MLHISGGCSIRAPYLLHSFTSQRISGTYVLDMRSTCVLPICSLSALYLMSVLHMCCIHAPYMLCMLHISGGCSIRAPYLLHIFYISAYIWYICDRYALHVCSPYLLHIGSTSHKGGSYVLHACSIHAIYAPYLRRVLHTCSISAPYLLHLCVYLVHM